MRPPGWPAGRLPAPLLLLLSAGCGGTHEPVHAVPDMAPPPPPPPAPVHAPATPAGWRAGVWDGPALIAKPTEAWSRVLAGPITEPIRSDGEHIYAVAEGRVYCFDLKGSQLWTVRSLVSGGVGTTDQGAVVGNEAGQLLVLDPNNGATLQSTPAGGPVRGVPIPFEGFVAWVTLHGRVASTGGWGVDVGVSAGGGLAADQGTAFVTTLEGELVATTATGVTWRASLPAAPIDGPALDGEHEYVPVAAIEGAPGGVVAFDRLGKEVWRHQTTFQPGGALAVGDAVYVPDKDGHVYALDRATGEQTWVVEGFGEFAAQPAVVEGQVYAGNGDGSLYRIDEDGGEVWKVPLGAAVTGDPVVVHGLLVVGLANGRLVALAEGG